MPFGGIWFSAENELVAIFANSPALCNAIDRAAVQTERVWVALIQHFNSALIQQNPLN